MARVPILLTVMSLALLSLPAAALADSAGGDQYVDPLAGLNGGDGSGSSGGSSSGGSAAGSSGSSNSSSSAPSSGDSSSSGASSTAGDSSNPEASSAPGPEATAAAPSSSAAPAVNSGAFSNPGILWGTIVVLCLALAGGGFALWRRSHGRS